MGFLIVLTLIVEASVLMYLEYKAWETLFTPLSFLLLPYIAVLLISIAMSGNAGFVEFYYPSITIWIVGLICFAVPDYMLAGYARKHVRYDIGTEITEGPIPRIFVLIGVFLILLFSYRLLSTIRASHFIIGSDEFAEEFAGFGFWGHPK